MMQKDPGRDGREQSEAMLPAIANQAQIEEVVKDLKVEQPGEGQAGEQFDQRIFPGDVASAAATSTA